MILLGLEFVGAFAIVFGLCVTFVRRRDAAREAKQELIARKEQEQRVAEAKSNDMWRANKHLRMP